MDERMDDGLWMIGCLDDRTDAWMQCRQPLYMQTRGPAHMRRAEPHHIIGQQEGASLQS